jgi:hypothetical protein
MGGNLFSGLLSQRLGRYRTQISAHLAEELVPERPVRALIFLSALLHDVAKPMHRTELEGGQIKFPGHEASGSKMVAKTGNALKLSKTEIHRITRTVADHGRLWRLAKAEELPSKREIYRFWRDNGPAGVDLCLVVLADLRGAYGHTLTKSLMERHLDNARCLLEAYFESPEVVSPEVLLDGHDLISEFRIQPGPAIGELLNELIEAQVEGKVVSKEQARVFVSELLTKMKAR